MPTEYLPTAETLARSLAGLGRDTERVYLTGPRPAEASAPLTRWAVLPDGWGHDPAGHHLDLDQPIWRLIDHAGRKVEVHRAAGWFGPRANPSRCRAACVELAHLVAEHFEGGRVLSTPATTGRELAVRSLPPGDWPTMSDELQELFRSTSGQGRIEVVHDGSPVDAIHEYDGRMMYAALCWGLGGGAIRHDDQPHFESQARGRYRVRFRPPEGWGHVGLLPVRGDHGGWQYPTDGTHETWVDGAELLMARRAGWYPTILERVLFSDSSADPLGRWARRMIEARAAATMPEVRRAIRAMCLFGLGAMHGRPSRITQVTPVDRPELVPADATLLRRDGDSIIWSANHGRTWPAMCHPEWTCAVWARARARLMAGPKGVGALALEPGEVVGFRTDAIYTTRRVPEWDEADDGRPGRYRHVGVIPGPVGPKTNAELLAAKRGAGL